MADKKQTSISGADFDKMCDTMITLANRGRKQTELVKRIAKSGDVQPVMEYINRFHKMFQKFSKEAPTRTRNAESTKPARKRGASRKRRAAAPAEGDI